jgi:threonine dehydrogenase-like Zn-dependent dehydrogenase
MRGLVFTGERGVALREFADPHPGEHEVVVAIRASGICGSDLRPYRAPRRERSDQIIRGHEPCGVVAERGPGANPALAPDGARVIVHHYRGCGRCKYCRTGWAQLCLYGHTVYGGTDHGASADFMLVPDYSLVPLPDELSFAEGAAIACGSGTAYTAVRRLDVSGRDTLAIFGQGPVGLSATLLATAMGARVVAVDVVEQRLAMARAQGAEHVVNAGEQDPVAAIRELTHGEGADATLDCTGNAEARVQAARAARTWGRTCYVGEGGTATFEMTPDVIHRQLTMYGSWTFSTVLLEECARFVVDRHLPLGSIFTDRYRLEDGALAFQRFDTGATGKGVFLIG